MYVRRVKDEVLDFDHRGWLYEESFTMYDLATDSLWVQAQGEAIHGKYKGTRLERLPATQTTWKQWRQQHPDTLVLGRSMVRALDYWRDSYTGYYETGRGIKYQRGKPLGFGLAVTLPTAQKLYPFRALADSPVLADRLGDVDLIVVLHAASRTAVAFERTLDGRPLDFAPAGVKDDDVLLRDRQTQSTWSGLTGRGLDGPHKGKQLRQVVATLFIVENWPLHYPDAPVYNK